ncbi:MAG TPA: phospholipase A [Rhodocyclaceae bacterium]|nr:phospholipase A [Rhodocyclaceae bacterium]
MCIEFGWRLACRRLLVLSWFAALPATAAPAWLIATPVETVRAGAPVQVEVVRPDGVAPWPETLRLNLRLDGQVHEVELRDAGPAAAGQVRRVYRGIVPDDLSGLARAELAGVASNRLALLVSETDPVDPIADMEAAPEMAEAPLDIVAPLTIAPPDEPALSVHEPMYFVVGGSDDLTARFQLSFKYRLLDPAGVPVRWFGPLAGLHFSYTQTSFWDMTDDSAPFRDTSYRPSFFWQGAMPGQGLVPDLLRWGYEHESNGRDGDGSRSVDALFAQPVWQSNFADGRTLTFAPKFRVYLDKSDNRNIHRYRGYADWNVRYGRENGWLLSAQLRHGTAGGSAQVDLSYPLRAPLFARTGSFVHLQVFSGYGQTLLEYDVRKNPQVRLGLSIVR